jgi:hypothetical protein
MFENLSAKDIDLVFSLFSKDTVTALHKNGRVSMSEIPCRCCGEFDDPERIPSINVEYDLVIKTDFDKKPKIYLTKRGEDSTIGTLEHYVLADKRVQHKNIIKDITCDTAQTESVNREVKNNNGLKPS